MTSPFITAPELAHLLDSAEPPVVIDASYTLHKPEFDGDYRSGSARESYEREHVPGAVYVDMQAQFADPDAPTHHTHPTAQAIATELARIGVGERTSVIVYDTTQNIFAARLWYLLRWVGVDARVLDGGLSAWKEAGGQIETGPSPDSAPVAEWTIEPRPEVWITKEELLARSADDDRPLVCGLPATNFSGADPSRYSRRGHIPGSVNVSSRDLFTADGTVRDDDEVRAAYESEGVTGDAEVLLYCGGGISASANALTLAGLGITAVRIYDGSLEEWSADESLPLEVTA